MSPPATPRAHSSLWNEPGAPCHPPRKEPACCHPCLMGSHVQGMRTAMHIHGQGPCQPALVWGGFFRARSWAGHGCKAPREGAPLCSPPSPLPAWWDASLCPGRAAPEVTFGGRPSPCHHGSKGRLMGRFYYSQFCRGILPLFIMAFPPVTGGKRRARLEQAVFALTSQGVFSEQWYLVLNPSLHFPSAGYCILLGEGGRALSWGVRATQGCLESCGTDPRAGRSGRGAQRNKLCAWSK